MPAILQSETPARVIARKNFIFLDGSITKISAESAIKAIEKIGKRQRRIYFVINTVGGNFYNAGDIRLILKRFGRRMTTIVFGKAYSGGLVILQGGSRRIATAKSRFMFHQANFAPPNGSEYNAEDLQRYAAWLTRLNGEQMRIFAQRAEKISRLFELFEKEAEFGTAAARRIGLIDEVVKEPRSAGELIAIIEAIDKNRK